MRCFGCLCCYNNITNWNEYQFLAEESVALRTLFDKLWDGHEVRDDGDGASLVAIDRVFLHERTGGVALKSLLASNRAPVDPSRVYSVMDHIVSFAPDRARDDARSPGGEVFITQTREMATKAGVNIIDTDDPRQGIIHVVAPELGLVLPGMSIVCPDSHTCSLGALGALAVGVGTGDVEHAMATGVLRLKKPAQMRIVVEGELKPGVTAKDVALHIIAKFGADGGRLRAIEFAGSTIRNFDIEARLTLCNMAVEFAAFTALIAPDEKTLAYVRSRPNETFAEYWDKCLTDWARLHSDEGAVFEEEIAIDAADIEVMATWGTSPEQAAPVSWRIPVRDELHGAQTAKANAAFSYMGVVDGEDFDTLRINGAFIGSCTNGRLSDLRLAAAVLKGRKVADHVHAVCVPGSKAVKAAAEAEGLDKIFTEAGFVWGSPGCAMCFYAGGETFAPGARIISSTNRNFEGRQGPSVRTHLASPSTVAASAIAGRIVAADPAILKVVNS
ncbi:MAG: 3-isopropylmalate dehydratase large subunit [Parvularculaceae bacterium]